MAITKDSASAHPSPHDVVPEATRSRILRGLKLFKERGAEIERVGIHTYRVPSCTGNGSYTVYTDLRCCTCPDHPHVKAAGARCKHVVGAEIVVSKRRAARATCRKAG